eukprot:189657-Pelagomonas_calceolata.AAC.1
MNQADVLGLAKFVQVSLQLSCPCRQVQLCNPFLSSTSSNNWDLTTGGTNVPLTCSQTSCPFCYAGKLVTTRHAIENTNTSHSQPCGGALTTSLNNEEKHGRIKEKKRKEKSTQTRGRVH